MGLTQTAAPTVEPVSLAELRQHLRIDDHDEDLLIESLGIAARQHCEMFTRRQFCTATWQLTLDGFPNVFREKGAPYVWEGRHGKEIWLPSPPLQSVSSITYVDTAGDTQTWAASNYDVDTDSEPGRVTLAFGKSWPTAQAQPESVTITYVAGYGAASDVPSNIKAAIKLWVGNLFENREPVLTGSIAASLPMSVESLLWGVRAQEAA